MQSMITEPTPHEMVAAAKSGCKFCRQSSTGGQSSDVIPELLSAGPWCEVLVLRVISRRREHHSEGHRLGWRRARHRPGGRQCGQRGALHSGGPAGETNQRKEKSSVELAVF